MLTAGLVLGIAVSVILLHVTGLSPGGLITPGYVAFMLDRPVDILMLLAIATVTWALVRLSSDWLMLYGIRRYGFTVLLGLALATGARFAAGHWAVIGYVPVIAADWAGFGYIVPGLLAHQFDRQGFALTLLMLTVAAPVVRLILLVALRW